MVIGSIRRFIKHKDVMDVQCVVYATNVKEKESWRQYQAIANERLNSDLGKHYRNKRPVEVEPVFGMIKSNRKYRRFLLRGMEKVEIEAGLFALAHNLKKMAN